MTRNYLGALPLALTGLIIGGGPASGHAQTAAAPDAIPALQVKCFQKFPDIATTAGFECLDFLRRDEVAMCLMGFDALVCRDAARRDRILRATGATVAYLAKGPFARPADDGCRSKLEPPRAMTEDDEPDPRKVCEYLMVVGSLWSEVANAEQSNSPYFKAFKEYARQYRKYVSMEGFQSTHWGEDRRRVAKTLRTRPQETITMRTKVAGREATVEYRFVNNKLAQVVVQLATSSMQPELDVRAFGEFEELLHRRYPDQEAVFDSEENDPLADLMEDVGGLGRTVRHGSRTLRTARTSSESEVIHTLWAVELRMLHQLDYRSVYLYPQLEELRKQDRADDL